MPHEETSPSFDSDDMGYARRNGYSPSKLPLSKLYQYECPDCGVVMTANWNMTIPMHCPDHKKLLQLRAYEPKPE